MLNDIVEKQLSEICRKCKLFDIDVTDCITQDSSDDSSDFSRLSHDHEQKRDLKKKKVKKDTFFSKFISPFFFFFCTKSFSVLNL
jgi:hypothetical protein